MSGSAPELTERFVEAVALAEEVHGRERRAGTEIPYLAHLLAVAGLVLEDGGDEDQAILRIEQERMAKRMNATIAHVGSSHVPMLSHPDAVARFILQAAA